MIESVFTGVVISSEDQVTDIAMETQTWSSLLITTLVNTDSIILIISIDAFTIVINPGMMNVVMCSKICIIWNTTLTFITNSRTSRVLNREGEESSVGDGVVGMIGVSVSVDVMLLQKLYMKFIDTEQFQRLRDLKQLGLAYMVYPGAVHSRFEHSLGVYWFAGDAVQKLQYHQGSELGIDKFGIQTVKLAGLLHDVGHGPYSHVFEREFLPRVLDGSTWSHEAMFARMVYYIVDEHCIDINPDSINRVKFCNEYAVPKDQLDHFKEITAQDVVCSQDVRILYQRVVELIQKHLDSVISSQISLETSNFMISFVLSVIKALAEGQKNFMDLFLTSLTQVMLRLSRDMGSSGGSHARQVWKASGVLWSGVHCLSLFKDKDEQREMLHQFFQILAIMEPRDLMDMFSMCKPELFECMISNNQLVHICSTLLQLPKVLRLFADVLVNFLVSCKLDVLRNPDSPEAKLVLLRFRHPFEAAGMAPSDCERILQPHVPIIMEVCMKSAMEVELPLGYMQLLRTIFRALNGGKFELLLRDLIPTLQPCLNMLLAMVEGPAGKDMRDLVLEFLLKTLRLQSWDKKVDWFKLGEGVMPASFKVLHDLVRNTESLIADFGESAIERVAPVDSGFRWFILLHAYTKSTGETSLAEMPECQKGMRLILS